MVAGLTSDYQDYQNWLDNQNTITEKALELIKQFGFKAILIHQERKPNFVRITIGKKRLDFFMKSVRSRFVKSVWLCKKEDFNIRNNYLIYMEKEEKFLISTGGEIDKKAEFRDSEYHKDVKYIVVPMDMFRSAKVFLKAMKNRYDAMMQRRMNDFI